MTVSRGNAVPETALTVAFTLLVLFGVVQLATTAFYQISADGATFVGAHDTVASVGNPSSANQSAAASAATNSFGRILGASVSVTTPSTSTFEADVSQQIPGISALGNPQALTVSSRLVEASGSTASASVTPLSSCTQASLNVVNGANNAVLSTAAVGLLQPPNLVGQSSNVVQLNVSPVTTRVGVLNAVQTDLNSTVSTLSTLSTAVTAIPIFGLQLKAALGTDLQANLQAALGGTFSSTTALATVDAQLTVQVPGVSAILSTVVNPLLVGATGQGLLGASGALAAVNNDAKALAAIDAGAPKCS